MIDIMSVDNIKKTQAAAFIPIKNQRGSAAVDYAVILVFVVLAVFAVIVILQDRTDVIFNATATVVGDFGRIRAE